MSGSRWRRQDGFIRENLWLIITILVIAVIVIDGFSIFTTYQSTRDDALRAARAAAVEYAQSSDVKAAKSAAQQALVRGNESLTGFSHSIDPVDGSAVFTVTASGHADTYVVKYLQYIGLRKWIDSMTNPSATRSSN